MPKISALSAGAALAGTEVVPAVQAGATVKSTIDDIAARAVAYDAELAAIAGLTSAADRLPYFTGSGTAALATFTAAGRALVDDADAAAQRTTLGLAIGSDVQAYNARLADIAGITFAQGDILYHDGSNVVKLAAGTSGYFLKTNGAGANPEWAAAAGTIGGATGGTDNAILRADGVGGSTLQASALTIDDTGVIGFPDGVRQTFNPDATNAGLNVGSVAGDPSAPSNGDLWYDSTANELTARINGSNVALGAGGGGSSSITPATETGTTYTVLSTDNGKFLRFTNAANVVVTVPQATGDFDSGFYFYATFQGTAGGRLAPTTSTINGKATYHLDYGGTVLVVSDGTNWQVIPLWGFYAGTTNTGFSLSNPDSTAVGGNVRGLHAVDLQLVRGAATQVAGGNYAFAAGRNNTVSGSDAGAVGTGNTASGDIAFASGSACTASGRGTVSMGESNTASAQGAVALGRNHSVSDTYSTAVGYGAVLTGKYGLALGRLPADNGNDMQMSFGVAPPGSITAGGAQTRTNVLCNRTNGSAAVRLTADAGAAGADNVASLANNSALLWTAEIVIFNFNTKETVTYTFGASLIYRGGSAATTTMAAGNPAGVAGPTTGTPFTLAAAPTITADTTNGGFNVSYTPPAANTDTYVAVCTIRGTEAHL